MTGPAPHRGCWPSDHVNADRVWRRLMCLAEFGATPAGGVNRQALSNEEIAAREALVSWAHEFGLKVFNDPNSTVPPLLLDHRTKSRRAK